MGCAAPPELLQILEEGEWVVCWVTNRKFPNTWVPLRDRGSTKKSLRSTQWRTNSNLVCKSEQKPDFIKSSCRPRTFRKSVCGKNRRAVTDQDCLSPYCWGESLQETYEIAKNLRCLNPFQKKHLHVHVIDRWERQQCGAPETHRCSKLRKGPKSLAINREFVARTVGLWQTHTICNKLFVTAKDFLWLRQTVSYRHRLSVTDM